MNGATDEIGSALRSCRCALVTVVVLSAVVNILALTGSFFMLEVYDRVLPSRSVSTLIGLAAIAFFLYAIQGLLDLTRQRMLGRIGSFMEGMLSQRAFKVGLRLSQLGRDGAQPARDLEAVRGFLQSAGPMAFFDLPWIPLYAGLCFAFHPYIGIAVLVGALLLVIPTALTEVISKRSAQKRMAINSKRAMLSEAARRNADALLASGMGQTMARRWDALAQEWDHENRRMSDLTGGFGAVTKTLRMVLQSGVLGLGAYLVIKGEATGGVIIASSILSARALAPVEATIANWKGFTAYRQSKARLTEFLRMCPEPQDRTPLPSPSQGFAVEGVAVAPPTTQRVLVRDVSFGLRPGQALGIIGPSASGKSSLVRALVGLWAPIAGKVRLDGAALEHWDPVARSRHVGYLPQEVALFAGTVAENIAGFEDEPDKDAVIKAATMAGVHDMILRLPDAYETQIGENGAALSAGQRQRVALARALYKDPFVVILDEPNSNLDQEGEVALHNAIMAVKARGGIVMVVAHRPAALNAVDLVLVVADGIQKAFGPRDAVLGKVTQMPQRRAPSSPVAGAL